MNTLKELIGQKVIYNFEDEKIVCSVIDVFIDDSHFEDDDEPIYITVNLLPNETYDGELIDVDDFYDVDLNKIRCYE